MASAVKDKYEYVTKKVYDKMAEIELCASNPSDAKWGSLLLLLVTFHRMKKQNESIVGF